MSWTRRSGRWAALSAMVLGLGAGTPVAGQVVIANEVREPRPLSADLIPSEVFHLGSLGGPGETAFVGPNIAVSNAPDGRLAVLDHEARTLRIFDATGRFIRSVGRPGRGPGEFSFPSALAWGPESELWVPEPFEARYSIFAEDGGFLRTEPRPNPPSVSRRVYPAYFDTSGALIDHFVDGKGPAFRRISPSGEVLARYPGLGSSDLQSQRPTSDQELAAAYRRHTRRLVWTLATDGTTWSAWSDELRLIQRSLEGDTIRVIETKHRSPRLVPPERALLNRLEREFRGVTFAPRVVQSIHASPDGRVFVQVSDGGQPLGRDVDVFDPEGLYVGTFQTPFPIQPLAQSDLSSEMFSFVGVGDYDIPVIVRLRLRN